MMLQPLKILVCGDGAYGQALTYLCLRAGCAVYLYAPEKNKKSLIDTIIAWKKLFAQRNTPEEQLILLPTTPDLIKNIQFTAVFLVVNARNLLLVTATVVSILKKPTFWFFFAKGIVSSTSITSGDCFARRLAQIIPQQQNKGICALYGPSVAHDLLLGAKTNFLVVTDQQQDIFSVVHHVFELAGHKITFSDDFIGAEIAFALKNVFGICGGIWLQNKQISASERMILVGYALQEIVYLVKLHGGSTTTVYQPAFIGDYCLAMTCARSRNFSLGQQIFQNQSLIQQVLQSNYTVEGVWSLKIFYQRLLDRSELKDTHLLPIFWQLCDIFFGQGDVQWFNFKKISQNLL